MPNEVAARVETASRVYRTATGRVDALHDVSIVVPEGRIIAVVGPSGSGKSTLLRLVAGMDRPTAGRVEVGEVEVGSAPSRALRHLRRDTVGYLFQRPSDNFVSFLSVGDHMTLWRSRRADGQLVDSQGVISQLGLADHLDRLAVQLSGGEQQRAAIAQLLVGSRAIVVADEPTAELDDASAAALLQGIRRIADAGVTFLIATHDAAVAGIADMVVHLDHGRLLGGGGPAGTPTRSRRRWQPSQPPAPRPTQEPPGSRRTLVRVVAVDKTYVQGSSLVHALRSASLSLVEGEVVGLVGRSGSGKTTLLNLIAGWERPDGGEVIWVSRRGRRRSWSVLAVLPQRLGLMEELTVGENIDLPLQLAGRWRHTSVLDLLEMFGLVPLRDRLPSEVSVGEQQRTALARAFGLNPRVMLLDEPTSHQDREWAERIYEAIRSAAHRGTCSVVATHDSALVRWADRVITMADGRLSFSTPGGT